MFSRWAHVRNMHAATLAPVLNCGGRGPSKRNSGSHGGSTPDMIQNDLDLAGCCVCNKQSAPDGCWSAIKACAAVCE